MISHVKLIAVGCIFSLIVFSSGCLGIQMPILPTGGMMPQMNIPIQPVPMQIQPVGAPTPTAPIPTTNITAPPTQKPRFVYV